MNSSMINAMTSLSSYQQKLDVLADNIANSNTVGYKRKEASFADLLETVYKQPDSFTLSGRKTPSGFDQGWGTRLSTIQTNFEQGSLKETGVPTDLAIEGDGLFQVETGAGSHAYTRSGALQLTSLANGDTILATEQGYPVVAKVTDDAGKEVDGRIVVPEGYTIQVAADGTVTGEAPDGTQEELGRIKLMQVSRPSALVEASDNLYVVQSGSNENEVLQEAVPGTSDIAVRQGFLEQSNVDMSNEVTELINVQRAYQLAARALSSSDTMMNLANNMRA